MTKAEIKALEGTQRSGHKVYTITIRKMFRWS